MGEGSCEERGEAARQSARAVGNPVWHSYLQESPEGTGDDTGDETGDDTGDDSGSVLYNRSMPPFEIFV